MRVPADSVEALRARCYGPGGATVHRAEVARQRAADLLALKAKAARGTREAHVLRHVDELRAQVDEAQRRQARRRRLMRT